MSPRVLHPNTRALIHRLRGSLPAAEPAPAAPAVPAVAAVTPEPFKLTPYQPKPSKVYKAAYVKAPSPQVAFGFAAPPDLSDFIVLDTEGVGAPPSFQICFSCVVRT